MNESSDDEDKKEFFCKNPNKTKDNEIDLNNSPKPKEYNFNNNENNKFLQKKTKPKENM